MQKICDNINTALKSTAMKVPVVSVISHESSTPPLSTPHQPTPPYITSTRKEGSLQPRMGQKRPREETSVVSSLESLYATIQRLSDSKSPHLEVASSDFLKISTRLGFT